MTPTKEQIQVALDEFNSVYTIGAGWAEHIETIRSLLTQAIEQKDVEALKDEYIRETGNCTNDALDVFDYLASRGLIGSVPDGYVLVPGHVNARAVKLLRNETPFFVVKASEPYARQVVDLIKAHEGDDWTDDDQEWADAMIDRANGKGG